MRLGLHPSFEGPEKVGKSKDGLTLMHENRNELDHGKDEAPTLLKPVRVIFEKITRSCFMHFSQK